MAGNRVPKHPALLPTTMNMFMPGNMARLISAASKAGEDTTRRLPRTQILNGTLIENVQVTTATATIEHKLSRQPRGWIICDINGNQTVWRLSWNTKQIVLDASGTVTISLWVF